MTIPRVAWTGPLSEVDLCVFWEVLVFVEESQARKLDYLWLAAEKLPSGLVQKRCHRYRADQGRRSAWLLKSLRQAAFWARTVYPNASAPRRRNLSDRERDEPYESNTRYGYLPSQELRDFYSYHKLIAKETKSR